MSSDKPSETQAPAESINPDLSAQGDITEQGAKAEPIPAAAESATVAETPVAPEPAAPTITAPASPSIAERISVPAQASADSREEDGGEWDLLSSRIKQFFEANNLQDQWQSLRQPLFLLGGLIVVILTMRIYGGILDAIATVPLAPRLFQLVGSFYAVWFAATRLIRAEERKKISANVNDLWTSLRGGSKS
tara:strand:- start:51 stop:626 length:576 start_codon:yes stop_codon:yes gene_type:complete